LQATSQVLPPGGAAARARAGTDCTRGTPTTLGWQGLVVAACVVVGVCAVANDGAARRMVHAPADQCNSGKKLFGPGAKS